MVGSLGKVPKPETQRRWLIHIPWLPRWKSVHNLSPKFPAGSLIVIWFYAPELLDDTPRSEKWSPLAPTVCTSGLVPVAVRHASETLWAKRKIWAPRLHIDWRLMRTYNLELLLGDLITGPQTQWSQFECCSFKRRWVKELSVAIQSCRKVLGWSTWLHYMQTVNGKAWTDQGERWDYTRAGYHIMSYVILDASSIIYHVSYIYISYTV